MAETFDYAEFVKDHPPLTQEQRDRLAVLLRPSSRGLQRISQADVDEVLEGIKAIGEVA